MAATRPHLSHHKARSFGCSFDMSSLTSNEMSDTTMLSPSKLPATDFLSYFPPFEEMGSGPSSPDQAGPSRRRTREQENGHRQAHGRSLGSLSGIMSFLSPVTPDVQSPDGQAVQALAKRVMHGKRRVLEPMTATGGDAGMTKSLSMNALHRRRTDCDRRRGDGERRGRREGLQTPTRRRPRPKLTVPLPPAWRFPVPSPPVTCLSPDIPLDAFTSPVENPLTSAPSSRDCSPLSKRRLRAFTSYDGSDDLSPTSSSGFSRPITPEKDADEWTEIEIASPGDDLHRVDSRLSSDSKETIRPERFAEGDGDVTPKAAKTWSMAQA